MSRSILSIKLKIILTYVMAFIGVIVILATTGYLTRLLETRVFILEEVSRLEERIQDLRRCEKNLFLYHDEECGRRSIRLIKSAKQLLAANQDHFERFFRKSGWTSIKSASKNTAS
jgi:hypothetical protein